MHFYQLKTQSSLHPNKPLTAFYSFIRYGPMSLGLYTQKNFAPSWSYTTVQIPLIRFTALAFIILQYFSIITQMLSCTCCNRDLLQSLKVKAEPKLCLCKQGRDHDWKTTKKRDICTLTLRYPEPVSKSASGVTVSKQDGKPLHLAEDFWEARLPRKSWKELL